MKGNSEKVIWITGASSGIGESLAKVLSHAGNRLIISSRNIGELERVKLGCSQPEKVAVLPMDLGDIAAMGQLAEQALDVFGRVDLLVNNAGISQRSLILNTHMEVYEKLMEINYLGTIALTKAILPYFIEQGGGHYVTVTSLMGKFGSPYRSGYCAAKHALHGFFDVLRMEHEKDGIAVTLVCPGFVNTGVARNALTGDGAAKGSNDARTAAGMDPDIFAKKMVRAMERKKFEVYIGGREVIGIFLKRLFPLTLHKVVLRSQVT